MTYDICMMLCIFISLGLICDNLVIVYLKWCALRAFLLLTVSVSAIKLVASRGCVGEEVVNCEAQAQGELE
jgi:hypothetical protein